MHHTGTTRNGATDRRCREFAGIADLIGPMAGQYLVRQEVAEARRAEIALAITLRDTQATQGETTSVIARLRTSVSTGLVRVGDRLRSRRSSPPVTTVGPVHTIR